ncbi:MAG: DUF4240 domain-containing protein [Pseudomonadota bacterium]
MVDEISLGEGTVFRPRYDAPERDLDRLQDIVVDLAQDGKVTRVPGQSLYDSHIRALFEKVLDGYVARGLYDALEAHLTHGEVYNTWPYEGDLARWRQLAEAGQTQRVVRLWRAHLACVKANYWYLISERNAGYRKPAFSEMSDASDRNSYAALIRKIPRAKADVLGLMAFARHWFEGMDVPQAQLDRLAADRAEVEAEERRLPVGKPDPRAMDLDVFWEVIGTPGEESLPVQVEAVAARLERFKVTAIKKFDKQLQEHHRAAHRTDIWALAYLLCDGCSDDSFAAFRCWLMLQGRAVFEDTLATPDAFDVARFRTQFEGALALLDVPLLAHEARSGKAMTRKFVPVGALQGADVSERGFASLLPGVAARVEETRAP